MRNKSALVCFALLSPSVLGAPQGGTVVSGSLNVPISTFGTTTTIDQATQNVAIDWASFNVGAGETVNFVQPGVDAIALNRDFQGSPSQVFGNINANGQVFLLNTSGVLIGASASIDVGSLFVSDMQISNSDAANFDTFDFTANGGTLPFSDQDLNNGGIEVLGNVTTQGANGLTLLGQYIYIEGSTFSMGGDTNISVAGTAVLVTDPSGLYGVQLIDPVTNDISGNSANAVSNTLFSVSQTPGQASIQANGGGSINRSLKYSTDIGAQPLSAAPSGVYNVVGGGTVSVPNLMAVAPPNIPTEDDLSDIEDNLTDTLFDEPEEDGSQLLGDSSNRSGNNLDSIMAGCPPSADESKECLKQRAIKRYLGKLLIGGNLPD